METEEGEKQKKKKRRRKKSKNDGEKWPISISRIMNHRSCKLVRYHICQVIAQSAGISVKVLAGDQYARGARFIFYMTPVNSLDLYSGQNVPLEMSCSGDFRSIGNKVDN